MLESIAPQKGEALYGAFFDHAQTAFLIIDTELRVVRANRQAEQLLELDPRGPNQLLDGFWSVSRAAVKRLIEGVFAETPPAPVSARTATDHLVEVEVFPLGAPGATLIGVLIVDRSTVDEAHQRLKAQEERYRSLFEWSPTPMREEDLTTVGVWLDQLRADGVTDLREYMANNPQEVWRAVKSIKTTRVNAAAVELMKAPSVLSILRGLTDQELTPGVIGSFQEQFLTLWEGGHEHTTDFVGMNFEGEPFECRLNWMVPQDSKGLDLSRVVVTFVNTTQLREAQRRLERLIADKDRFIASVSHELRTPLAAVLGLAEELHFNWDRFDEVELRELVGIVAAQSTELSAIVEDLLVAANLDSGRVSIRPTTFEVNAVAVEALMDCLRSHPGVPSIDVTGPPLSVMADVRRVRQILRNLIINAVRYGGDHMSVSVNEDDGRPYVEVTDDGEGIPLEYRESIFVPYFQASEGEKILGSLGLGLSISRELARRMGGDLTYSFSPGSSCFRLTLRPAASVDYDDDPFAG